MTCFNVLTGFISWHYVLHHASQEMAQGGGSILKVYQKNMTCKHVNNFADWHLCSVAWSFNFRVTVYLLQPPGPMSWKDSRTTCINAKAAGQASEAWLDFCGQLSAVSIILLAGACALWALYFPFIHFLAVSLFWSCVPCAVRVCCFGLWSKVAGGEAGRVYNPFTDSYVRWPLKVVICGVKADGGCFPGTPLHDGSGVRTPRFAGALASPVPGLSSCIQCVIVLPILQSCFGLSSLPDMGLNATDAPSQIPIKGRKRAKAKGANWVATAVSHRMCNIRPLSWTCSLRLYLHGCTGFLLDCTWLAQVLTHDYCRLTLSAILSQPASLLKRFVCKAISWFHDSHSHP